MYTPLYVKTNYSFLDSLVKIDDLIKTCVNYGIKNLAITDNNMIAVYYFYKKCIDSGIKPIIGLETKYKDLDILLYAKNYEGYKALIDINLNSCVTYALLDKYYKDLVIIIPFENNNLYEELKKFGVYLGFSNKEEEEKASKISSNLVFINKIICIKKSDSKYYKYAL